MSTHKHTFSLPSVDGMSTRKLTLTDRELNRVKLKLEIELDSIKRKLRTIPSLPHEEIQELAHIQRRILADLVILEKAELLAPKITVINAREV